MNRTVEIRETLETDLPLSYDEQLRIRKAAKRAASEELMQIHRERTERMLAGHLALEQKAKEAMSQRQTVTILLPEMEKPLDEKEEQQLVIALEIATRQELIDIEAKRFRARPQIPVKVTLTRDSSPSSPTYTGIDMAAEKRPE